jgi:hypothetical protein
LANAVIVLVEAALIGFVQQDLLFNVTLNNRLLLFRSNRMLGDALPLLY